MRSTTVLEGATMQVDSSGSPSSRSATLFDGVRRAADRLREEVSRSVVGQDDAIEQVLIAVLCRGHVLIEGVPGLGKTLLARAFASAMDLSFRRIQFTPDLLPSDITGAEVIQTDGSGDRCEKFMPGPLFAQLILADEINRAPPKTQAALLEAMEERQVTVGGVRRELPCPFHVLATENPVEQEGTYRLPQAELDRFLMKVLIDYPDSIAERRIIDRTGAVESRGTVVPGPEILGFQELIREAVVAPSVVGRAASLTRKTRPQEKEAPDFVVRTVACGASPRSTRDLVLAAQARAVLAGRAYVGAADIDAMAAPVLRHRIVLTSAGSAEGVSPDDVLARILDLMPRAENRITSHPQLRKLFR